MFYLIRIRQLANKLLKFSSHPVVSVGFGHELWPLYYRSFHIQMIRDKWPKHSPIMVQDAIDLLIKNGHAKRFPHNSPQDVPHLQSDYKALYFRYIATDEGVFAYRSKYYWDDLIFNVILGRLNVIGATLGLIIAWLITQFISWIASPKEATEKHNTPTVIIFQRDTSISHPDTIWIKANDSTTFLIGKDSFKPLTK